MVGTAVKYRALGVKSPSSHLMVKEVSAKVSSWMLIPQENPVEIYLSPAAVSYQASSYYQPGHALR